VFYGFSWPFYYKDLDLNYFTGEIKNDRIKKVNDLLASTYNKLEPFLSLDEFINRFEDDTPLKEFIIDNHFSLPEKYALFSSAQV
jgi:hypothetical protein